MSINGLQQQYFPSTLDGLTYLDVDGITIDGTNVDIENLVPYTLATKEVDLNSQNIKTTRVPVANPDLTNKIYVDGAVTTGGTGTLAIVNLNFVRYTGSISDTDLGAFKISSSAVPTTGINLTNKTYVDAQDALLVPYSGATSTIDIGSQNITTTRVPLANPDLTNKNYVDTQDALRASLTGNNTLSGTNSFTNTVSMTPATAAATFSLGLNGSNQIVKFTPSSGIGGSVSTGYVPYASASNTLADSAMFQSGGNVGVGTVIPAYKFQVAGTGLFGYIAGSKKGIFIANEDSYGSTPCIQGVSAALGLNDITLNPGGGSVAVGRLVPSYKLHVEGDIAGQTFLSLFPLLNAGAGSTINMTAGNGAFGSIEAYNTANTVKLPLCLNGYGGNVAIGKTTAAYKLDVAGSMRVIDGNNSYTLYGPNNNNKNLVVGSYPLLSGPDTASVQVGNGDLYIDAANSKDIYYGYNASVAPAPNTHRFYGGNYNYDSMPQNSSQYSQVCVMNGGRMFLSQAVAHQVVVYASNSWAAGTNLTYAFYRYNGYTSQMIIGRLSYYVTGATQAYPTIRIYSQSTGQYWYFQTNNYTNVANNHITVPIYIIFNEGYTTATGFFDIYVYNAGNCNTDANDILDIHVITLPVSSY